MLISICIPHYNRAKYLLKVLDSIKEQTYPNIEVIISDDCSTDDSLTLIKEYIKKSEETGCKVIFNYLRQPKNLGYDANLRASLAGGSGDYLFILGNDDGLSSKNAIKKLVEYIKEYDYPEVTFCNFMEYAVENSTQYRTNVTGIFGQGPEVAIEMFRCFSFVAGIAYKHEWFQKFNTDKYDGSVFFQIYLSTKIIAAGGRVCGIKDALVAKDIKIGTEKANSFMDELKARNKKIHEERGALDKVFSVALAGVKDETGKENLDKTIRKIYTQLYLFSYPFWLYEYRKEGVYKASVNLAIGCRPTVLINNNLSIFNSLHSWFTFVLVTTAGLCLPLSFIDKLKNNLKVFSKRYTFKSLQVNNSTN